ncbi:Ester hydrolase C11orf54 [Fulvia fulva]|uniref:Ester hydrolase C11orf54 n=1 Tax=Passalora fulva TaxID=5499 RepID=A0A9Q8LKG1_PASFU|nr:Ester hydrolase C11orf54 [Fulvia fulva]KAK4624372.1 Ester hydrolase C11orf54 [Fulvia fulva]KAK4624914.1 Ester hydrolase C11orf54 [Fulvia fulva]UJO18383.1 Ester hydrolase C11orf54 [Fulvia fulva]WPV15343.1 Ester hydrolase C11orf54 [Fulvia fulva]WPV30261.1 Ester hydrolase C11orf54 [Fulvia fulva]
MLLRSYLFTLHLPGTSSYIRNLCCRLRPSLAAYHTIRTMNTTQHQLSPPALEELVTILTPALEANFEKARVSVEPCPDLRKAPYYLATEGLSGEECVADIGGQPNLFPEPRLECKYSLISIAKEMQMSGERGQLLGAGAGPFHDIGMNSELAPNLSWQGSFDNVKNLTYYTKFDGSNGSHATVCEPSPSANCALMINLYGSAGKPGSVLKITARSRKGDFKSFTECIRRALADKYGDERLVSIGGVFLIKTGKAHFHVMPDFPAAHGPPFKDAKQLNNGLTYHDFEAPIVCLSVFHSADPGKKLGLRLEHTHCFSLDGGNRGGHYHYDLMAGEGIDEVEYEAYFNVAKTLYRIDQPEVTLERDLHD